MDHRFLNSEVPPFDRVVPTTENIVIEIWRRLDSRLSRRAPIFAMFGCTRPRTLFVDYGGEPCS